MSPRLTLRRTRVWLRRLAIGSLIIMSAVLLSGSIAVALVWRRLPAPEALFARRVVQSTKIYDRTGAVLLYEIHGEERRTVIPFSDIPDVLKHATIAIEDANFYRHAGLDPRGILRAVFANLRAGAISEGGSTITQQLVKKSLLTDERTFTRKIKEAILAVALEARYPKDQILASYLNQIPYGSNAYGIEAAAQTFFGKHARELTIAEAALLAALPKAPSYFSPYGQRREEVTERKNHIINRMATLGFITPENAHRAKAEPLAFLPEARNIRAPHFVMHVRDYLMQRYGEEEIERGGLIVTTTLDWEWQEEAERLVGENAERNEQLIKAKNMALVAIEPSSGEIRALVGSRNYFDVIHEGNFNVATALRQPGSAFKPFVYAAAFAEGFSPSTVLFDVPTEFNAGCGPDGTPHPGSGARADECYHPQNYDETFRGPVTLRQAIAQSLNVPSVKLLYLVGVQDAITMAERLGIGTLADRDRFGLSLVLGGAEVRLLEMVSAYGVFAADGVRNPPTAILSIKTATGEVIEEKKDASRLVLDQQVARLVNDVLSDNDARIPAFQPRSSLYFPDRKVAAKTGTTQDYRDAWTIGYTPHVAIGVWAGNNDNTPIQQKGSGVMAAAPTWHSFMEFALNRVAADEFPQPEPIAPAKPVLRGIWQGGDVVTIDTVSQKRATEFTPPEFRRDIAFGEPHDPLHWIDTRNPGGPPPVHPALDPQYANWEDAFRAWLQTSGFVTRDRESIPADFDDVHTADKQPRIRAQALGDNGSEIRINVATDSLYGVKEIALVAEELIIAFRNNPPSEVEFIVSREDRARLPDTLEIRAYDRYGNIGRATVRIP